MAGKGFVWEARVSGRDARLCTFDWSVTSAGGYGLVLFGQNTFLAESEVSSAGTYTVSATAMCGDETGTGSLSEHAVSSGTTTTYSSPGNGSAMARLAYTADPASAVPYPTPDDPQTVCYRSVVVVTHSSEEGFPPGLYRWRSAGCGSGGGYNDAGYMLLHEFDN